MYRELTLKNSFEIVKNSSLSAGAILIILPFVNVFTKVLLVNQIPQSVTWFLANISSNKIVILLMIDLIIFIAGLFLNGTIILLVLVPLLIPTAASIGLDLVHLGVVMFVGTGVGTITPPMAMGLFVAGRATNLPVVSMLKPLCPFLFFVAIPIFILVTFIPELSLFLPRIIMGYGQ
jgi:C4-dicarboxylate transporter DctM subunit